MTHERTTGREVFERGQNKNHGMCGGEKKKKRNHSLSLRVSSVYHVCAVRFIQQEAHACCMTIHHCGETETQ